MSAVALPGSDGGARLLGALAIVLSGLLWSGGGLFFRLLESPFVWSILIWRFLAVMLFFVLLVWVRRRGRLLVFVQELGWRVLPGACFFAGASLFFVWSLSLTTVFNAVMMLAAQPILAAGLAWLVLREAVRASTWLAMLVAGAGIFLMVRDSLDGEGFLGTLLALVGSLCFAAYAVFNRWVGAVDTAPVIMVGGLLGAAVAALFAVTQEMPLVLGQDDILLCAAMSLLLGFGFVLFNWGSRLVPAAESLVLVQTEMIFGPIWVWLVFAERPTDAALLGGLVILLAVLLQAGSGLRRPGRAIRP